MSFNIWGGRQGQELLDYLQEQARNTDIFCLQEVFDSNSEVLDYQGVRPHLLGELKSLLPGFSAYFAPAYQGYMDEQKVDFHVLEGQAIFVKNNLQVKETGAIYIYGDERTQIKEDFSNEPKILQFAKLLANEKEFLVVNVHGKWYPGEKLDTKERLEQSEKILEVLEKYSGPKIISGDFNLMPETQSIKMLEKSFKNLIKDFNISSTRNKISWQAHKNIQHFADYTFVSPDIQVKTFEVPYNEVSDHLPMLMEFEL